MSGNFKVGDTFTHVRDCDRYRAICYAGASGDFNPIHIDGEVGKAAGLGGAILQGLCTMAWATEAAALYLGDAARIRRVRVRFSRPVAVEDTITVVGRVVRFEEGLLVAELAARNQRGEEVLVGGIVEARA